MAKKNWLWLAVAGALAGTVNGLLGAGGGMVLVPLLTKQDSIQPDQVFPASVSIILPICVISLVFTAMDTGIPIQEGWPYLMGSIPGGLLAGKWGKKIPALWLHRGLGLMILWGGIRYLC